MFTRQQHAEPDQVDAELFGDRADQRDHDERQLEEVEEEREEEDQDVDHDQEAELAARQAGQQVLDPARAVDGLERQAEDRRADQDEQHEARQLRRRVHRLLHQRQVQRPRARTPSPARRWRPSRRLRSAWRCPGRSCRAPGRSAPAAGSARRSRARPSATAGRACSILLTTASTKATPTPTHIETTIGLVGRRRRPGRRLARTTIGRQRPTATNSTHAASAARLRRLSSRIVRASFGSAGAQSGLNDA